MVRFPSNPRSRATLLVLVAAGAVALPFGGASAGAPRTIAVPGDFPTIQAAVDAARPGDTVQVALGTYNERVTITDHSGLTLTGGYGSFVDGGPGAPAITVTGGENIHVIGFTLYSGTDALRLVSTSAADVRNVHVASAGGDGIRGETLNGTVNVEGSRIDHAERDGIHIDVASVDRADVTIARNTIGTTGGDGIFAYSAEDRGALNILENDVSGSGRFGIRTDCGYAEVRDNDVRGTGSDAISVYRTRSQGNVIGNTIADAGGAGISFVETPGALVDGNEIRGTVGDGVNVTGPMAFVRENTIVDAGGAGVRMTEVATTHTDAGAYNGESIGANVIERSGGAGIVVVQGIGISIEDNRVADAGGTAIEVGGSELRVTDNAIDRPAGDGVSVVNLGGRGDVVVSGNKIVDAGVDGIDLGSSDGVLVAKNRVDGSGDCGFRLDGGASGNRFRKNVATACGSFGLMESDEAGANRFDRSNRFGRSHRRARQRR